MNRSLVARFGGDRQSTDAARLLRVAGFRNHNHEGKPPVKLISLGNCLDLPFTANDFHIPLEQPKPVVEYEAGSDAEVQTNIGCLKTAFDAAGVEVKYSKPWDGVGLLFELVECPWSDVHTKNEFNGTDNIKGGCGAMVFASGAYDFKCFHDHCVDRTWDDFKAYLIEHAQGVKLKWSDAGEIVFPAPRAEIPTTLGAGEELEENEAQDVEEPLPDFTSGLTGSIADYCRAVEPDFPMEFKVMSCVTKIGLALSGKTAMVGAPNVQPRFFTALLAEAGWGKTGSIQTTLLDDPSLYATALSVETGPALVATFQNCAKHVPPNEPLRLLISPDEIKDVFEKSKASKEAKDSLGTKLLLLFENNSTGNNTKQDGDIQIKNAHLAMLGGATPSVYDAMWGNTAGAGGGMQSRMTPIGTNNKEVPLERRETNTEAMGSALVRILHQIEKAPSLIHVSDEAKAIMQSWWNEIRTRDVDKRHLTRMSDIVKRYLIVLAVSNDTDVVNEPLMRMGVDFGNHVLAMRIRHNPQDASNPTQQFENRIEPCYRKHGDMTDRQLMQRIKPDRFPGGYGAFNQANRNLREAGRVMPRAQIKGSRKHMWGL
jgi:hypothetical protein